MAFAQDQFDLASLRFDRPSRCLQVLRNHGDRQELHIVRRRHVCRSNTRIPAPSEHHVRIQPAGKRNRRHRTTRLKRLLHDLALERQRIIPRSSPSTCQNSVRQNLMGTSAPHRAKKTSNSRHPSRAARPDAYSQVEDAKDASGVARYGRSSRQSCKATGLDPGFGFRTGLRDPPGIHTGIQPKTLICKLKKPPDGGFWIGWLPKKRVWR